ncbi:histone deacetylase 8-like [Lingula anatina]|uniref:Histone deacetylase n=1 Tax=Lingula anatina TaxID=7574 RepID=A0A1S3HC34_LINAN|nr:histone deacetylase 8-like [Lingula anatina]|eukprot:XP_013383573.1 histone deacetylase 8-like [Lingula anatina]
MEENDQNVLHKDASPVYQTDVNGDTGGSNTIRKGLLPEKKVVYVCSADFLSECDRIAKVPFRASITHALIEAYGLLSRMSVVPPKPATFEEICHFHSTDYIECLQRLCQDDDPDKYDEEAEEFGLGYDCPADEGVYDSASWAAGGTLTAAEHLVSGQCSVAINWAGGWHHAKRDSAAGFCYINDIVLGILKLRTKYDRVLYVDIDLHHGDGVEDAFCATSKVMTVSFHKYSPGFFPGTGNLSDTGIGKGAGYTVNVPLNEGCQDENFYRVFEKVMDIVKIKFDPEAVVCQCGADGLAGDPMDSFNLTTLSLAKCVQYLLNWSVPLLLLGGGGYHIPNTARCWTHITSVVTGTKLSSDIPEHRYFTLYGPDYDLMISPGNRADTNTPSHIKNVIAQISENLENLQ